MRDIKRIDKFCHELAKMWKRTPDQRFGQLMINFFSFVYEKSGNKDIWFFEEPEMEKYMNEFCKEVTNDVERTS